MATRRSICSPIGAHRSTRSRARRPTSVLAAARRAARAARRDSRAGRRRPADPDSRRLPPRSGAARRGGFRHPRLRRRSGAVDCRAAREAVAAEGRRQHDPLVRLRRLRGAVRVRRCTRQTTTRARTVGGDLGALDHRRVPDRLSRRRAATRRCCRATPQTRDALLSAFTLDKALRELGYELHNRPDWVRVPLAGVNKLIRSDW